METNVYYYVIVKHQVTSVHYIIVKYIYSYSLDKRHEDSKIINL